MDRIKAVIKLIRHFSSNVRYLYTGIFFLFDKNDFSLTTFFFFLQEKRSNNATKNSSWLKSSLYVNARSKQKL